MSGLEAIFVFVLNVATSIASIPFLLAGEMIAYLVLAALLMPFLFASEAAGNFIQRRWGWAARRRAREIGSMLVVAALLWLPLIATIVAVFLLVGDALLN